MRRPISFGKRKKKSPVCRNIDRLRSRCRRLRPVDCCRGTAVGRPRRPRPALDFGPSVGGRGARTFPAADGPVETFCGNVCADVTRPNGRDESSSVAPHPAPTPAETKTVAPTDDARLGFPAVFRRPQFRRFRRTTLMTARRTILGEGGVDEGKEIGAWTGRDERKTRARWKGAEENKQTRNGTVRVSSCGLPMTMSRAFLFSVTRPQIRVLNASRLRPVVARPLVAWAG